MDVQGWVVVGLAVILFGYLVPHLVHTRHQLAQSRVEDRFSGTLRVVTTGAAVRRTSPGEHHGASGSRPYLHGPRRGTEAPAVNRPTTQSERAAAEARRLAAARAARAAEISRRRAAARRRLVLTVVLLLASTAGWLGFGLAGVTVVAGVVPTLLLGTVLVLGRRAARIAARRNAADRAAMARLERELAARAASTRGPGRTRPTAGPRTSSRAAAPSRSAAAPGSETRSGAVPASDAGTGSAAAPAVADAPPATDASTDTVAPATAGPAPQPVSGEERADRNADATAPDHPAPTAEPTPDAPASAPRADAPGAGSGWTPVPVPAPSYTLKPAAPRRDIAPYEAPEPETPAAAQQLAPGVDTGEIEIAIASGLAGSPYAPVADPEPQEGEVTEEPPARGLDLDSVLARRRAVGA